MNSSKNWKWASALMFVCGAIVSPALGETIVTAGDDAFRTPDGGAGYTFETGDPIPADFFGPGSDPFTGTIDFNGDAIDPGQLGPADTLVRRLDDTGDLDIMPSAIAIEIVALRFVSAQPITVTYAGINPEDWDVDVCLTSFCVPCVGQMTITKTHEFGGTYNSVFPVVPRFTFTRVSDQQVQVLDFGDQGTCADICAGNVPGVLDMAPESDDFFWALLDVEGGPTAEDLGIATFGAGIGIDSDCDGEDDDTTVGNDTTNFAGGVEWTGGRTAGADFCRENRYAETAFGVLQGRGDHSSYISDPTDTDGDGIPDVCEVGRCCIKAPLPGSPCVVITEAACKVAGGRFDGIGTVCPCATALKCDGVESGGTGTTSCPAGDPRDYAYPLQVGAAGPPVTLVEVGTDDCNPANYMNPCMPLNWTFNIVMNPEDHDPPKTPHGVATGAATGNCLCVVSFAQGTGAPIPPLGTFTFGYDYRWHRHSHDVGWLATGGFAETWGAPSGDGVGPVHGPGPCHDPCEKGDHWVDDTCPGEDEIDAHGAVIGIDLDGDCVADTSLRVDRPCATPTQLVSRSKPYEENPGDGHRNKIDTEIIHLCIETANGTVQMWAGAGNEQQDPSVGTLAASLGTITEQAGDPTLADSSFDMFVEINLGGGNYVYNQDPLIMAAEGPDGINCVPPTDDDYFHPFDCLPLYTDPDDGEGTWAANLVMAQHWVAAAPRPVGACCAYHCEGCPCIILTEQLCVRMDKNAIWYGDGSTCVPDNPCDPKPGGVPTVSGWGLVVVTLLVVAAGTIMLRHRRRRAA